MLPSDPQLHGTEIEQPKVVKAIGCQLKNGHYGLAAFIRHHDPNRRLATTTSKHSLALCAREMDANLAANSIDWDGSYRLGTSKDIWDDPSEKPPDALRLILDN